MSDDRNTYVKSMEMETLLTGLLNVDPDSKTDQDIKGFYQSLVYHERGYVKITPSEQARRYKRYLGYFDKAMTKLAKRSPRAAAVVAQLRTEMPHMSTAADMLDLYERLKPFRG